MSNVQDLTGEKFGKLTVIGRAEKIGNHRSVIWECRCECGAKTKVRAFALRNGSITSCGCVRRLDIAGKQFGKLTAIAISPEPRKNNQTLWQCLCECGLSKLVPASKLVSGHTSSCGCLHRKHGHTSKEVNYESKTYHAWHSMKERCYNPATKGYERYGGRGIKVCQEWREDFRNFLQDMGETPEGNRISLDRINTNGHYCCGHCQECTASGWEANCRWSNPRQQANNKRNNRLITYDGRTQTLGQWCQELNVPYDRVHKRLSAGWSVEEALTVKKKW